MKLNVFTPLQNRSYRTLFLAQLFADLGNWLDLLALNALISFTWNLGLDANAALVICMGAPFLFIGPLVSVWVDRIPSKVVMLACTVLRLFVIVGFFFTENLYILLPLVFMKSALASAFEPARQSMLRSLVSREVMAEASSLGQMVLNSMKIIAPTLGGLLLTLSTPSIVFAVEGILYLFSIIAMLFLPSIPNQDVNKLTAKSHFRTEFLEGFHYIFNKPVMRSAVSIVGFSTFIIFLYDGFFAPLITTLGIDTLGYGLITSSFGIGSVIGALMAGQFTKWREQPLLFMAVGRVFSGFLLLGVGCGSYLGFAHGNTFYWFVHFTLSGAVGVAMTVPYSYLLQTETPPDLIGRISSVSMAIQGVAIFTAPSFGAAIGDWLGLGAVFLIAGGLMMSLGIIAWRDVSRHARFNHRSAQESTK